MTKGRRTVPPDFTSWDHVIVRYHSRRSSMVGESTSSLWHVLYHKTRPKTSPNSYYTRTSRIMLVLIAHFYYFYTSTLWIMWKSIFRLLTHIWCSNRNQQVTLANIIYSIIATVCSLLITLETLWPRCIFSKDRLDAKCNRCYPLQGITRV